MIFNTNATDVMQNDRGILCAVKEDLTQWVARGRVAFSSK